MEIINYIIDNINFIFLLTYQHIKIVGIAVLLAIITGVPIGILITFNENVAKKVLQIASIVITIPSIALFGLMIPLLSQFGYGIGQVPAVVALVLYSQLPIIRNSYTAVKNLDSALVESAKGMGMSKFESLRYVEIPIATPIIIAGVRVAVVLSIGVTAIASYIGAGGLGLLIARGIAQTDGRQLFVGALFVSLIAILSDLLLLYFQNKLSYTKIQD